MPSNGLAGDVQAAAQLAQHLRLERLGLRGQQGGEGGVHDAVVPPQVPGADVPLQDERVMVGGRKPST